MSILPDISQDRLMIHFKEAWDNQASEADSSHRDRMLSANNREVLFRYGRLYSSNFKKIPLIRKDLNASLKQPLIKPFYDYVTAQFDFWYSIDRFITSMQCPSFTHFQILNELLKEKSGFIDPHILTILGRTQPFSFVGRGDIVNDGVVGTYPVTESLVSRINKGPRNVPARQAWRKLCTIENRKNTRKIWELS